ncbi:MAG: serine/threonine protein kinase [Planctomycetes bacterium]|nr:serine/threonine protein kinase [Planctomycetota bacterium]
MAGKEQKARSLLLEELFEAAVGLPLGQRDAFLLEQCGDQDLRRELEKMLENDSRVGDEFLKPPPPDPRLAQTIRSDQWTIPTGTLIGSYTIISQIAHGGMGTVYLAEQEKPRRTVALKVLQSSLWTKSAERRFDVESHILGYLRHPNIAQVYEAGAADVEIPLKRDSLLVSHGEGISIPAEEGARRDSRTSILRVHYFAMEYVPNARTIIKYADEQALSLRQRLELFLQLCDAVAYGHQKGVIHRDLKPANVLVGVEGAFIRAATVRERVLRESMYQVVEMNPLPDGRGSDRPLLKVIDFGIARATDSDIAVTTMHTEAGQILGTLAYMSPEQCAADPSQIDTTTDVYSLGVILYELLTGRMPYDVSNMTIQSAARVICEKEPTRPSAFDRCIRADIETIILKAIEKGRDRRYVSSNDLANDIRRYLRGEPIEARPHTKWTRILRWAIRNPKMTTATACVLIGCVVLGSSGLTLWYSSLRPDRVIRDDDGRSVRLISRIGGTLHTWNAGAIAGITFAELVESPVQFGGGKLVLLGFSGLSKTRARRLCAFDLQGDWETPKWEAKVEDGDLPDDLKNKPELCGFHPAHELVADFFPSQANPGDEVAVVFAHSWSRRLVRIYDLTGKPLYGFWQDGGVDSFYWMKDAGLLVCGGASEAHKAAAQNAVGNPSPAPIIFAVNPVVQETLCRTYLIGRQVESAQLANASHDAGPPVWCEYLHPPGLPGLRLALIPDSATGIFSPGDHVGVCINAMNSERDVGRSHTVLDRDGRMVSEPRAGDTWNANKKEFNLPDPEVFVLSDAPPTDSWPPRGDRK